VIGGTSARKIDEPRGSPDALFIGPRTAPEKPLPRRSDEHGDRNRFAILAPLLLIVAEAALTGWVIRDSYFYADDWLMFGIIRTYGINWTTLSWNFYLHFTPISWLLHGVVQGLAPLNYTVAWFIIVGLVTACLLSLWWVLRQLDAPLLVVLVGLGVFGISPLVFHVSAWFETSSFIFPYIALMLLCTGFFLRWCRWGRRSDLFWCWIMLTGGLLDQELPLLLLPAFLVLRYVVIPADRHTGIVRSIWRDRFAWLPFLVTAAVYLWWYRTHYYGKFPAPSLVTIGRYYALGTLGLGRALLGAPTGNIYGAARWLSVTVVIVAIAAVGVACIRSRFARRALHYFMVAFVLKIGSIALGLGGHYPPSWLMTDPQYFVDLGAEAVIAVALALSPWIRNRWNDPPPSSPVIQTDGLTGSPRRAGFRAAWGIPAIVAVVCVLHVIAAPFGVSSALNWSDTLHQSQKYVANVENELEAIDNSPTHATIIPLDVPASMILTYQSPYNDDRLWLKLFPQWRNFDVGPVEIITNRGTLMPTRSGVSTSIDLSPTNTRAQWLSPVPAQAGLQCFATGLSDGTVTVTLAQPVTGPAIAADVYLDVERLGPGAGSKVWQGEGLTNRGKALPSSVIQPHTGNQRFLFWLGGGTVGGIEISKIPTHTSFCLESVQVGSIVSDSHAAGVCHPVTADGSPLAGRVVRCGQVWA
jgi:hypothetical protein